MSRTAAVFVVLCYALGAWAAYMVWWYATTGILGDYYGHLYRAGALAWSVAVLVFHALGTAVWIATTQPAPVHCKEERV